MIEFSGSIFGAPAMQLRVEPLDDNGNETIYSVKVVIRDPAGDHVYQRALTVPKFTVNIFGILTMIADVLPIEAQLCKDGAWIPTQDETPLELPSA